MSTRQVFQAIIAMLMLAVLFHATSAQSLFNYTNSSNATIVVNLTAELNNSAAAGYNFTANSFEANSSTACSLAQISKCDNNLPSQFVCINSTNEQSYLLQHQNLEGNGTVCPQYVLAGFLYCQVQNGACVVARNSTYSYNVVNTTNTTSTINQTTICNLPNIPTGCSWVSTANATALCAGYVSCISSTISSSAYTTTIVVTTDSNSVVSKIIRFFQNLFKGL